jgi:hypothetical protein
MQEPEMRSLLDTQADDLAILSPDVSLPAPASFPAAPGPASPTRRIATTAEDRTCDMPQIQVATINITRPSRSLTIKRAYEAMKHHHVLLFQHHRARYTHVAFSRHLPPALTRSAKRIRSFIMLMLRPQRPLVPESAPSLAETEQILMREISLPLSPAPGLAETEETLHRNLQLPLAEQPNFHQTVRLVAEHLRANSA